MESSGLFYRFYPQILQEFCSKQIVFHRKLAERVDLSGNLVSDIITLESGRY
jgi:hypothetical protein